MGTDRNKSTVGDRFRLERFGKAMSGTGAWETPGAVLQGLNVLHRPLVFWTEYINLGLDWASLPPDSIVVDVGGGIGSTTMLLAEAFGHLQFVVQDRKVVVGMGEKVSLMSCLPFTD
jgi:hypothetical protein